MWTKDRTLLENYHKCIRDTVDQLKEREDVDLSAVCSAEYGKLMGYTNLMLSEWTDDHPLTVDDKKASYFTPKMPYFQQF